MLVPAILGSGGSGGIDIVLLLAIAVGAGFVGSLLGIGGGLFLVPALFLLFGVDIRLAIAASLISVVATSCGSAAAYVKAGLTNLRLAMFLEIATATGGLLGALLSVVLLAHSEYILVFLFVPVVLLSAWLMLAARGSDSQPDRAADGWSARLRLGGAYTDPVQGSVVSYNVTRSGVGLGFAGIAGVASGLLGIGGGLFKVPAMSSFMNVPIRVAVATSNFMIGVTASAGALVYLFAGQVSFGLAAPVAIGVVAGSYLGSHYGPTTSTTGLKTLFAIVLVVAAVLMLLRALGYLP
ncbi:MAG: sulfite exporter TauE/SafE family protein [Thermoplasmata archaeon]